MVYYDYYHRVRYGECDPMRVVYHTRYLDFFEAARTEALRDFGMPYAELEEAGVLMPVVEASIQYRRSALYDDLLQIRAIFPEVPQIRATVDYEVRRMVDGEPADPILVTGRVVLCFLDAERHRPVRAPQVFVDAFERLQQSISES
ncbi:MAG: thioesterase family protein [Bacteroidota bacterium]